MLVVGLTGGLACGKSHVARTLAALGCHVIQADELGHKVLEPGGEAFDAVVNEFGNQILDADNHINRRKLAAVAFSDPEKLKKLSEIVHPAVSGRQREILDRFAETDPSGIAVVEAAILVETGSYAKFDRLILVHCRPEQQFERAMHRDGLAKEEVEARMQRQLPFEMKKRVAHYIIETSGTKEQTEEQTRAVYESLRAAAAEKEKV